MESPFAGHLAMHMNILRKWRISKSYVAGVGSGSGQELSEAKVLVGCWHNRAHDDELPLTLDNKQQQKPRAQKGIMTWTILFAPPR